MSLLGALLVLVFILSQSVRDVSLGSVFQRFDFFLIILLAFLLVDGDLRQPRR